MANVIHRLNQPIWLNIIFWQTSVLFVDIYSSFFLVILFVFISYFYFKRSLIGCSGNRKSIRRSKRKISINMIIKIYWTIDYNYFIECYYLLHDRHLTILFLNMYIELILNYSLIYYLYIIVDRNKIMVCNKPIWSTFSFFNLYMYKLCVYTYTQFDDLYWWAFIFLFFKQLLISFENIV